MQPWLSNPPSCHKQASGGFFNPENEQTAIGLECAPSAIFRRGAAQISGPAPSPKAPPLMVRLYLVSADFTVVAATNFHASRNSVRLAIIRL
jgi:hypothetical protein